MTRLLLVGGGHAHLEIVRRRILAGRADLEVTLVSVAARHHYSGMVPGYLRGTYREEEVAFDLPALVRRASGTFVDGRVTGIDPRARRVFLDGGDALEYDLVSFGVGSDTKGSRDPGVRENVQLVKPIARAVALRRRVEALCAADRSTPARVVVVGAGAAGVEIACAVAAVLDEARPRDVTLVDAAPRILDGYAEAVRRLAEEVLLAKRIARRLGEAVESVGPRSVRLAGGESLASDLTVWVTGPRAWDLFRGSGLALDARGFLLVDDALRSVSDPRVFAAGDCGTLARHPETPKAGVYAVRQGPVLWESLLATADGRPLPTYTPQRGFLSILNTADGKALLRWGAIVSYSRWAWRLKDTIDRRFMRRYQRFAARNRIG